MSTATQTGRFASPYSMRYPTHGASELQQRYENDLGISLLEMSKVESLATDHGLRADLARLTGDLCQSVYKDTKFTPRAKFDPQLNNVYRGYVGAIDNMRSALSKASTQEERLDMLNSMRAKTVAFATRIGQQLTEFDKADASQGTFAADGPPSWSSLPIREQQRLAHLLTTYPGRSEFGDGRFVMESGADGQLRCVPLAANQADLRSMLQARSANSLRQTASQFPTQVIIVVSMPASSFADSALSSPKPYDMFPSRHAGLSASSFGNSIGMSPSQRVQLNNGFANFLASQRASRAGSTRCGERGSTLVGPPHSYAGGPTLVSVA